MAMNMLTENFRVFPRLFLAYFKLLLLRKSLALRFVFSTYVSANHLII